jgi:hypothetical protein
LPASGIHGKPGHGGGERPRVAFRDEHRGLLRNNFSQGRQIAGDHRQPGRHVLEQLQRREVRGGVDRVGSKRYIGLGQDRGYPGVGDRAHHLCSRADEKGTSLAWLSDDDERWSSVSEQPPSGGHGLHAVPGSHPADEDGDRLSPPRSARLGIALDRHRVWEHLDTARPAMAGIGGERRAHSEDQIGPGQRGPLEPLCSGALLERAVPPRLLEQRRVQLHHVGDPKVPGGLRAGCGVEGEPFVQELGAEALEPLLDPLPPPRLSGHARGGARAFARAGQELHRDIWRRLQSLGRDPGDERQDLGALGRERADQLRHVHGRALRPAVGDAWIRAEVGDPHQSASSAALTIASTRSGQSGRMRRNGCEERRRIRAARYQSSPSGRSP